jgi:hypothetical protein
MTPTPRKRLAWLIAGGSTAVALTYALTAGDDASAGGGIELATPTQQSARTAARTDVALREPAPALAQPARATIDPAAAGDPFAATSFAPPPPPPPPPAPVVAPPPPPPPKAPPLPFTFVGMVERGTGKPQAFLAKGDALHIVAAGDVVEEKYRVETLTPTSVVLTYLPLSERQVLNASGSAQ